jgi:transcriptional regulator with XRE-family HTH domain
MRCRSLSEYIEKTKTTETELANQLGISQGFLNEIKNGKKRPSPDLAAKIESVTGIPFRKLLLGDESTAA